ncbi:MAG: hypothetical protein HQL40_19385 [Alphaproteobacteria bacterium]|nr:hypothetical protein [Alphaproteobacteria bacterium]
MSVTSQRLNLLRALTAGAKSRSGLSSFNHVDHELQELGRSIKVSPERRKHLLQVFHGVRALETALKEVVRSHGFLPKNTLGGVLHQLSQFNVGHPAHLDRKELIRFSKNVKDARNKLMHQANVFPNSAKEADSTLGEIAACFALLVR